MLDAAPYPLRAVPAPTLPVARMVEGQRVEAAAALLPRLFNLCRVAQEIAARAAFGLPLAAGWQEALCAEIQREHVVKLCLKWPGLLSLPAVSLPCDWQANPDALRAAVFGPEGRLPADWDGFNRWLAHEGASPAIRAIDALFAPGEAVRAALPLTTPATVFAPGRQENSAAARQAHHPVLAQIEAEHGRGPLWSAMGVAYDLEALLDGARPALSQVADGAVVPAARGLYAVRARVENGRVAAFARITPTDHLLAEGGALDQSLASLPVAKARALAPLLLSVLDPCFPVTLNQGEAVDA